MKEKTKTGKAATLLDVIMNPVRLRIVQYLLAHQTATVAELQQELPEVPAATMYRHLGKLQNSGFIGIEKEEKVRGTVRKTYCLMKSPITDMDDQGISQLVKGALFSLICSFDEYFNRETIDPVKDMLGVSTSTLLLSDKEMEELYGNFGALLNAAAQKKMEPGRKIRRITLVSSPGEDSSEK